MRFFVCGQSVHSLRFNVGKTITVLANIGFAEWVERHARGQIVHTYLRKVLAGEAIT